MTGIPIRPTAGLRVGEGEAHGQFRDVANLADVFGRPRTPAEMANAPSPHPVTSYPPTAPPVAFQAEAQPAAAYHPPPAGYGGYAPPPAIERVVYDLGGGQAMDAAYAQVVLAEHMGNQFLITAYRDDQSGYWPPKTDGTPFLAQLPDGSVRAVHNPGIVFPFMGHKVQVLLVAPDPGLTPAPEAG